MVVALLTVDSAQTAELVCERIKARVTAHNDEVDRPFELSLSVGATRSRAEGTMLADLLAQRRTPALELTVDATCEIEGGECGGKIRGLHVCVLGRGAGLEPESFGDSAHLALACCPISHALGATVGITLDADLAR